MKMENLTDKKLSTKFEDFEIEERKWLRGFEEKLNEIIPKNDMSDLLSYRWDEEKKQFI